jgi:hypothetical protein
MTSYPCAPNAVDFPFEISRSIPQALTIYDQVDLEWVRGKVRENPFVTLQQLAELIHQQFGVKPSISHMLRIQQLAGISRIPGSRAKQVAA